MASASTAIPRGARLSLGRPAAVWLGRAAVPVLLVAAWAIAATSSSLVPGVGATVDALAGGFRDGWIWDPLWSTGQAVLTGFLYAAVIGIPLGAVFGVSRFAGRVFDPFVSGLFAVPRIVVYPVLLAYFGVGLSAKLWMAALSALFPILMSTTAGVREVDPTLVKLGRSVNCSRLQLARKIYLPAATPTLMVGLRIGFSIAFIATIVAELFASTDGLGRVLQRAYAQQDLPRMWAVVVLITAIAFVVNLVLWSLERRLRTDTA
jgi:NitT/TauT family transport system permease protein